jgi:hypothetical protein
VEYSAEVLEFVGGMQQYSELLWNEGVEELCVYVLKPLVDVDVRILVCVVQLVDAGWVDDVVGWFAYVVQDLGGVVALIDDVRELFVDGLELTGDGVEPFEDGEH